MSSISAKPLYTVTILRRKTTGTVVLNYTSAEPANNAFAGLTSNDPTKDPTKKIFKDDFGCKVSFDPEDIGTVVFMDYPSAIQVNAVQEIHKARMQKKFEEAARADPVLSARGNIVAASPLDIPR